MDTTFQPVYKLVLVSSYPICSYHQPLTPEESRTTILSHKVKEVKNTYHSSYKWPMTALLPLNVQFYLSG